MRLPDCFWTLTELETLIMARVEITGSNGSGEEADPLLRLPSSLVSLDLRYSPLIDATVGQTVYEPDWDAFFTSKRNMTQLTLNNVGLGGSFLNALPGRLSSVVIFGNPLMAGSISPSLLSNYAPDAANLVFDFSGNGITGSIPSALFSNFAGKSFSMFSFRNNSLNGSIPTSLFADLEFTGAYLVSIDFSDNEIEGSLPSSLFGDKFWNVQSVSLNLGNNRLTGTIPATLLSTNGGGLLSSLTLRLNGNQLQGLTPALYNNIAPSLKIASLYLDFAKNQLVGPFTSVDLPPASMAVSTLTLDFASNFLVGTLPSALFATSSPVTTTVFLGLSRNRLSGEIDPAMLANTPFTNLQSLTLSLNSNNITGPLTAEIIGSGSRLAKSLILGLSGNPLGVDIPEDLFSAYAGSEVKTTFLSLSLANCSLTGSLPKLTAAISQVSLSLDGNSLSGVSNSSWSAYIKDALSYVRSTLYIDIGSNDFTGELSFPSLSARSPSLLLYARDNNFTTMTFGESVAFLSALDLGSNERLTGTLPSRLFASAAGLSVLFADGTALSGEFPDLSNVTSNYIDRLDLSNTAINFCPSTWTAPWLARLTECKLANTNVGQCLSYYPATCQVGIAPTAGPTSPSTPSAIPTAPVAPGTPSSVIDPSQPSPSAADSLAWNATPIVFAFALLIALVGF